MSAIRGRKPGHGAVAVLVENGEFLVIRRSPFVRAPNMLCFAGGTIEEGESPEEAIVREMEEELGLVVEVERQVFQSRTSWGTLLEWILVTRKPECEPVANTAEVSEWMWITANQLLERDDLLPSVPDFFVAWSAGELELPDRAGLPERKWLVLRRKT